LLEKYNADIIVCQEAEKLESDFFEGYHYEWVGKNIHKGIGVLTKKYHIDYAFIRGFKIKNIEVGDYSDWIKHSDHMPLIIDIEDQD